jgi:hypothetical protein
MRRLLQRIQDGLYYEGPGMWSRDPKRAFEFRENSAAVACCLRENLPPAQLVLKFEDSVFDIRLPCYPLEAPSTLTARKLRHERTARAST